MPTVNLYYRDVQLESELEPIVGTLKSFIADQLTCQDISLTPDEVSIRLLRTTASGMLADIELDITAAPFPERVGRQDEICLKVRAFLTESIEEARDIRVWLNLHELGHSWD